MRQAAFAFVLSVAAVAVAAGGAVGAVEIRGQLERARVSAGESVGFEVVVGGGGAGVRAPELVLPAGLELLGTSRATNFSWVNGRGSMQTVFRYEIGALRPGQYAVGPVRVQVGREVVTSGVSSLVVTAAAPGVGAASGDASLLADVEPREPWVGQSVILRVRLVLGRDLAEQPSYVPPVTTGFWAEASSRPESYYATLKGRRVLVTETRAWLYPLAPGVARIGPASAGVVFQEDEGVARMGWLPSRGTRRELALRSQPLEMRVRPLPPGAPQGFDGAVGTFAVTWSADRSRTSQDVPVTVRLELRGVGNLPLIKAPLLAVPDGEVFAGTADDSLPTPGTDAPGRRRFQWNVLPRHVGTLRIAAPIFAWFDPQAGVFRSAGLPPVAVEVGPPLFSSARDHETYPAVLVREAPDPFARGLVPWVWAVAGLLAGAAAVVWRIPATADPHVQQRGRVASWRNALRGPGGPAFWRAAEEVADWLGARGRSVADVRDMIDATRYGGGQADVEVVRLRLSREVADALPPTPRRRAMRPAAVVLAVGALAVLAVSGLRSAESANSLRLRAADRLAREGEVARARAAWYGMWQDGARAPALAARLAWAEARRGALGPAAVWVLRGEQSEVRDPALAWISNLVREGGGLAGSRPVRLPVRRNEWAVAGLVLGVAAGALWPRRGLVAALAVLALATAGVDALQDAWAARVVQAVVSRSVTLEGTGLELDAGQVVQVMRDEGAYARVRAGRDLDGRVPAAALLPVGTVR